MVPESWSGSRTENEAYRPEQAQENQLMHLVAIHHLENAQETHIQVLAKLLSITPYEARPRVMIPGGGPAVVGVFAQHEQATQLASALQENDFSAFVVGEEEQESETNCFVVRNFYLESEQLRVESRQGQQRNIRYSDIDLILRGHHNSTHKETQTEKSRKFNVGRAVLSGGLMLTRSSTKTTTTTTHESGGFMQLYAPGNPTLIFQEQGLLYESLGSQMKPARSANFAHLAGELRRLAAHAKFDDRMLRKASQKQILGPTLDPETFPQLVTSVLAKSLRL